MMCARCNKAIDGTPERLMNPGASGAGGDILVCPVPCRPAPQQTTPSGCGVRR